MRTSIPKRFTLERVIQERRGSKTFLASDNSSERSHVLVKLFRKGHFNPDRVGSSQSFSWFLGVRHRHIANLLDGGLTPTGDVYFIREYFPDSNFFRNGDITGLRSLLSAVSFLHSNGRIHGGIKPSNVFVTDGVLKLTDPLIYDLTASNDCEQYVRFSAPEVLKGSKHSVETDLYSVGAFVYRFLLGEHPFDDSQLNYLRLKYMWASPRPLLGRCQISKSASDAVLQLLDKDPRKRKTAFAVLMNSVHAEYVAAERAPFVGREAVMEQIRKILCDTSHKMLRVLFIEGPPGIGKSRLIEEMKTSCSFEHVLFVVCGCTGALTNFDPILQGVRQFLRHHQYSSDRILEDDRPNFSRISEYLFSGPNNAFSTPEYPVEKVISDLVCLVRTLARSSRIVFVLEDIDRADSATVKFLEQLSFRAAELPLKIILTQRTKPKPCKLTDVIETVLGKDFIRIRLECLVESESEKLAAFVEKSAANRKAVLQVSAGNPRFLEAYSKANCAQMPADVKNAVIWTISNIRREDRTVAETLSLFTAPVGAELIAIISGETSPVILEKFQRLDSLGFLRTSGSDASIYPAARTAIYKLITRKRRELLNRDAFKVLQSTSHNLEDLARYSFEGKLFAESGDLYRQLANNAVQQQNYSSAESHYQRMKQCAEHGGPALNPREKLMLGKCYEMAGKMRPAKKLYESLLSRDEVHNEPELLSVLYVRLANMLDEKEHGDRIRLLQLAIESLPNDSPQLTHRYTQLCSSLIRTGDLSGASQALKRAEANEHLRNRRGFALPARATLLLNSMDFRAAADCLMSMNHPEADKAALANNLAICFEHLGDLNRALELFMRAQQVAIASGNNPVQILSLANLGSIKTKLGDMTSAQQLLENALTRVESICTQGAFNPDYLMTVAMDAASYYIQTADYRQAAGCLKRLKPVAGLVYEADRVFSEFVRCEFYAALGDMKRVKTHLSYLSASSTFKSTFFQIEKALMQAEFHDDSYENSALRLKEALTAAEGLGTFYQQCKLLNQLASIFIGVGAKQTAAEYATKALRLARKKGYRPLAAKALVLMGQSAESLTCKQHYLYVAFQNACEMNLRALVAEVAFHIGVFQIESRNFVVAREYLVRSLSLTQDIADGIPANMQASYRSIDWHRSARKALETCNDLIGKRSTLLSGSSDDPHDNRYFAATYRLTISTTTATSAETIVTSLAETIAAAISRPVVIALKHGKALITRFIKIKPSEELMVRIRAMSTRTNSRINFGTLGKLLLKETFAWISLSSQIYEGGIYVMCRPRDSSFKEREIEFLTVVGAIADSALKRIETHNTDEPETTRSSQFHGIIGASKAIKEVYSQIQIAAGNAATVLIEGESGTGKELVAKAIHAAGPRVKEAFVAVDCGAIPEALIEAELFGAKKGSYTGAVADRPGLFEAAHRGTIFLDEISNTSPALQAKLLRVIQEREVRRIGETKDRAVDVRLIVASNQNLEALASDGRFRKDLLYRLKVLHIKVPPLRSRRDDIPMLAHAFLQNLNTANKTKKYFAPGIINHLSTQTFPGNVRELQNALERAFFSAKGIIITEVPLEGHSERAATADEVQSWFEELSEGRKDFWSAVHNRYKRRDISREKVVALVDFGLRSTKGSYKTMAAMFHLKEKEYRRFMDFLRRNECLLDFRPYRKSASVREG